MKNVINKPLNSIMHMVIIIGLIIMAHPASAHDGHHTNQAWLACDVSSLGDNCSYIMQTDKLYKGTCRQISQALMCVRNQPIETLSADDLKALIKKTHHELLGKNNETAKLTANKRSAQ